jgi:XTP/dITP diphosphohydrolase
MKPKLLIATGNPGKQRELLAILATEKIEIISTQEISVEIEVQETGSTYGKNAHLKAQAYLAATGLPVLADDSGLEVDILNGAPGIYSARYAPKQHATDADRRAYLLAQLKDKPHPWSAHFHCSVVLALPGGEWVETQGFCHGVIIPEERGSGGFGYDPVFYIPEYQATMAELPSEVKNKISHRARALAVMLPVIQEKLLDS